MSRMTKAWVHEQIEHEIEMGNHPGAVRDLAALVTVYDFLCSGQMHEHHSLHMTRDEAEAWVSRMDHIHIRMPYEEVERRAINYGIEHEKIPEFYAAFNMIQSDYGMVAKEFGVSTPDFYAAMAKAWIMDDDAVEGKTALYEKCIVKSH